MKNRKAQKLAMTTIGAWWLRNIVVPVSAFHLRRAARRDEHHGFPYTAAIEWRHAAELFAPNTPASEHCWRQWERIMRLPRRLAEPLSVPLANIVLLKSAPATRPVMDHISSMRSGLPITA